jgi:hypothetical protein
VAADIAASALHEQDQAHHEQDIKVSMEVHGNQTQVEETGMQVVNACGAPGAHTHGLQQQLSQRPNRQGNNISLAGFNDTRVRQCVQHACASHLSRQIGTQVQSVNMQQERAGRRSAQSCSMQQGYACGHRQLMRAGGMQVAQPCAHLYDNIIVQVLREGMQLAHANSMQDTEDLSHYDEQSMHTARACDMQGQQAYGHTHQGMNLSISGNILETREYNRDQHCSVSAVALPGPPHYRALLPGFTWHQMLH